MRVHSMVVTPGGHRRYPLDVVLAFLRDAGIGRRRRRRGAPRTRPMKQTVQSVPVPPKAHERRHLHTRSADDCDTCNMSPTVGELMDAIDKERRIAAAATTW